jgi:thiol:disulfide interchange protein DsbC
MQVKALIAALSLALALPACGESPDAKATAPADPVKTIRDSIQGRFPGVQIGEVRELKEVGLYEVVVNGQEVAYADKTGGYLFIGQLLDMKSQRDLTKERIEKLTAVPFDSLPLDKALKLVKGDGSRRIAVFSDPDCPFCRRFEQTLASVDNVTVYTFLYPIPSLHPKAVELARQIWCAPDRQKAWENYMLSGTKPEAKTCDNPIDEVAALGEKLRVNGTPTVFFTDGSRAPGWLPAPELEKRLAAVGPAQSAASSK